MASSRSDAGVTAAIELSYCAREGVVRQHKQSTPGVIRRVMCQRQFLRLKTDIHVQPHRHAVRIGVPGTAV